MHSKLDLVTDLHSNLFHMTAFLSVGWVQTNGRNGGSSKDRGWGEGRCGQAGP